MNVIYVEDKYEIISTSVYINYVYTNPNKV